MEVGRQQITETSVKVKMRALNHKHRVSLQEMTFRGDMDDFQGVLCLGISVLSCSEKPSLEIVRN
jgi:hypothetical protein